MSLVSVADFEREANRVLAKNARDYYASGAGNEVTLQLNKSCYSRLRIRPRCLRNVATRDLSTQLFGCEATVPFGIAPTAMGRMAHADGECANAKAAANAGAIFILSTIATSSIEEVAAASGNSPKWFQLYIYTDRRVTENLVRRAEHCGFRAIVLTVDTPMFGLRRADIRNKFALPPHLRLANFTGDKATGVQSKRGGSGLMEYVDGRFDMSLTWDDVDWLVNLTKLPVVLKGILTAEDALLAVQHRCAGIIVSNHGARQLDTVPATIEVLPEIVAAVGSKTIVMLDGGIREGTDVFKALALGARMVFVGRPSLWGLAVNGQNGVTSVLEILRRELDLTMALAGCTTIADITKEFVVHESEYAKL